MQICFYQNGLSFTTSSMWPVEYNVLTERENTLELFVKGPWAAGK